MARDQQRQRVYDAENALPSNGREYPTVADCKRRVNQIVNSAWWKKRTHKRRRLVSVHDGRGHRRAVSYGGTIALPKWARNDRVILHELAHEACPRGEKHGSQFARTYYDMVRRFWSVEMAERLLVEYAARGVKVDGKRLPRSKVTVEVREAVAKERTRRAVMRKWNSFETALEDAKTSALNVALRVTVFLEPGCGWMYGHLPNELPLEVAWGRARCKAVVTPEGEVHLRP